MNNFSARTTTSWRLVDKPAKQHASYRPHCVAIRNPTSSLIHISDGMIRMTPIIGLSMKVGSGPSDACTHTRSHKLDRGKR